MLFISGRNLRCLAGLILVGTVILQTGCGGDEGGERRTGAEREEERYVVHEIDSGKTPNVAFVTNGIADFWTIAEAGAQKAADDLGIDLEVRMPPDGVTDQERMLEELLSNKIDGIAISPIDPDNQLASLNSIAKQTNLITHDSDADESNRLCYVGMNNYDAGRMCGELVKEAIPDGGEVMIFVGRLEQLNARLRRQGVIDELLDRSHDPTRYDRPGEVLEGDKYTILDTRTDQFDRGVAKNNAEDSITAYPDLACMVGLFEYNPPLMLRAVRDAGKLGEIAIVGFDENDATLQAIKDGTCIGTIVQNPYEYGYQSVTLLNQIVTGNADAIPESRYIDIPARKIRADNVDEFWTELKSLVEGGESSDDNESGADNESTDSTDADSTDGDSTDSTDDDASDDNSDASSDQDSQSGDDQ